MAKLNYYKNTFEYFRRIKPSICDGLVLDYGSNYGTFLDSSKGQFPQKNYTGIDVDKAALEAGRHQFPDAKFIWFNSYNPVYNPNGTNDTLSLPETYDTIISYSVFTHTSKEDMLEKIQWLYQLLKPGGSILATWLDVDVSIITEFFYRKRIKTYGACDRIMTDSYVYLLNNKCSKQVKANSDYLLAFYKKNYLISLLEQYNVTLVEAFPDIKECFQSCFIIEKKIV